MPFQKPTNCNCGALLGDDEWLCLACRERSNREIEERRERERRDGLVKLAARPFDGHSPSGDTYNAGPLPPRWPWCTIENPEFQRKAKAPLRKFAAHWMPSMGPLLIIGDSGGWKTSSCLMMLKRLAKHYLDVDASLPPGPERTANAEELRRFSWTLWVKAHDLALARRMHSKFGAGDAELVDRAISTPLLIVDEAGSEPLTEVLFFVIDSRYSQQRPTVMTSGLDEAAFKLRYGDAMWRRLTEKAIGGDLINVGARSG